MRGIAGTANYLPAPLVNEEALLRARDPMHARGLDGAGLWISRDGMVGLAHRRLAILDLTDRGTRPMATEDKSLWITYNDEIYNFRELRGELEAKGVRFRTGTDTEVLLELYRSEGPHFLRRLRGMFAFALWDAERRCLLLARDPFGIKPLYFSDDGKTLRFASQVKALLAGGEVDESPSPAGQVGFCLWGHVPEPHTIYKSIRSLPPSHAMLVSEGGRPKTWKYHELLENLTSTTQRYAEPGANLQPEEALRRALEETVRYHIILLKNSIALSDRTSHRQVDCSECGTSDASGPGRGSTTPRNQSEASAEEFFNRITWWQTFRLGASCHPGQIPTCFAHTRRKSFREASWRP
jgi:asparagine synthase (glutamine-hydrolysing)